MESHPKRKCPADEYQTINLIQHRAHTKYGSYYSKTKLVCEKWNRTQRHKGTEFYLFEVTEFTEQKSDSVTFAFSIFSVSLRLCVQYKPVTPVTLDL